ncbi:hypothetical protein [Jannaschia seohaensis]|uniref:Uncharacterized protein n=1 Tax=Jannaschia seohaensis TaxID=475081 RepID=A0A2Y9B6W3_9RHOB|nr:hypothetical protein [Jannaschia seohaensis]PWJ12135.1 hypothetical protein BCF38_11770 [Jannaschia seohaensis]SSA51238.1 hypothetical protein SAMN05421539_11770 [Jannaschia seohaensis]
MKPTYLTHSRTAHVSVAILVLAAVAKLIVTSTGLPIWLLPVSDVAALVAAATLFIGWVRWTSPGA